MDNRYLVEEITVPIIMAVNEISLKGWSRRGHDH